MRLIQLFEKKNHYLEKFFALNELQLKLLQSGEIGTLDEFYLKREKILEIINYIDSQASEFYQDHGNQEAIKLNQKAINKLLFIKDEYVHHILEQDLNILEIIDRIKSNLLTEITDIKSNRVALGKYHTQNRQTKIDEKA